MAAPTLRGSSPTGATDAGGAWAYTCGSNATTGDIIIVYFLQDGGTAGAISVTGASNIEDLAGTDNAWTALAADVAGGGSTRCHAYIGRSLSTSAPTISGGNSTSEDLYIHDFSVRDVNPGTTLASVIENSTAGNFTTQTFSGDTVSDADVVTLAVDRMAINLVFVNDDQLGSVGVPFTGETGGDWTYIGGFESSTGTDGSVSAMRAAMASAGTISGGSLTLTGTAAGAAIGFALIGTTAGGNTYTKAGYGKESG